MTKQKDKLPAAIENRIIGEGYEPADQLLANPFNWRKHPKVQQDALESMLRTVGWVQRVIVNKTTGHIVDGHLRVEVALRKGERVPVLYVELTPDEEKVVLAAIDPIGGLAETDQAMLDELLAGIETGDKDLDAFLSGLSSEPQKADNEPGEPGESNYSEQYGVIVMCRDASEQEAVYNRLNSEGFNCKVVCT